MPPYLAPDHPDGGEALGHSGIKSLSYDSNTTVYKMIRDLVDKAAPGLLSADAEVWTPDGRVIGRRQGAVDALQALFAHGRERAMMQDLLSRHGHTLYVVNPIGWLLADVVKINLSSVLTRLPRYEDFLPGAGLENYGHNYESDFTSHSQEGAQNITLGRLASSTENGGGGASLALSSSHHRGNNHATTTVNEQTIYDWGGHFTAVCRHRMTVHVERMGMGGRPLNDYLADGFRNLRSLSAPLTTSVPGTLELQIPRSIAEMKPLLGPQPLRTPAPLPKLPGDCAIVAVQMDGLLPAAQQLLARALSHDDDARTDLSAIGQLVARVFSSQGKTRARQGSATLEVVLSRSHLASHLRDSTGGTRITLANDLFLPGKSSERVKLTLTGELYNLEILAPIQGSGAGRYSKSQSATTSFGGSNRGLEITASGSGAG
ncbi:hypothetical protein AB0911_38755, partial [Streptomyces nigra]|uniref:hypothetical protein n=1 Tax=Streptomyces nigra TaxID=1827580 RepID=UPI0034550539